MGLQIAQMLQKLNIPCVIIELDHRRFEQAKEKGLSVVYGDANHPVVLEAAAIERASLLRCLQFPRLWKNVR
ncbi:MAG: NAD-binding protein [Planctomycetota bacterium]|nr:NAD-binding protein [Planctomycetota bacterium]